MKHTKKASGLRSSLSMQRIMMLAIMLIITTMLIILIFYFNLLSRTRQQTEYHFHQLASTTRENFENSLTDATELAEYASYSNTLQRYLLSDIPTTVIEAKAFSQDILNYIARSKGNIADIVLFSSRGRKLSVTNSYSAVASTAIESLNLDLHSVFRGVLCSGTISHDGKQYLVCLTSAVGSQQGYHSTENTIIACLVYNLPYLLDTLSLKGYPDSLTVLVQGDTVLGSSSVLSPAAMDAIFSTHDVNHLLNFDGIDWFYDREPIRDTDWELIYLMPQNKMPSILSGNQIIIVILLAVLSITFLMLWLLSAVHRDIGHLVNDITYSENGSFQIRFPKIAELQIIATTLRDTLDSLHEANVQKQRLTDRHYKALLAQKQAQMLAYRTQISPHFLFNTLETARSIAHHYHAEPLENLLSGMSQMFRYSLHSPDMVKLSDELEHLDGYFLVLSTRFPGRYTIKKDIAPDTLSFPILSMLLQPLAENAVFHAFQEKRTGVILIQSCLQADGQLIVRVADNGCGLTEDELQALNQHIHDDAKDESESFDKHIGLHNIRMRLKLTFGDHAHLYLRSVYQHYTVAELVIPASLVPSAVSHSDAEMLPASVPSPF